MSKIIGIDLGTTNSCVAVMEGKNARVIPNAEGVRTTPSMVAFTEDGERLVGHVAKRQAITNAENTVYAVKRLIGRKFDDPQVQKDIEMVPVQDRAGPTTATPGSRSRGQEVSPPEVSAMVLQKMKQIAEDYLGEHGHRGGHHRAGVLQRRASARRPRTPAGSPASTSCASSTSRPRPRSPTASTRSNERRRSRSTTSAAAPSTSRSSRSATACSRCKSTAGDTFLGGEDFDQRIIDWLVDEFEKEHGIDLRKDRMALQRLKEAAEKAKCELSSVDARPRSTCRSSPPTRNGPMHLQHARCTRERSSRS